MSGTTESEGDRDRNIDRDRHSSGGGGGGDDDKRSLTSTPSDNIKSAEPQQANTLSAKPVDDMPIRPVIKVQMKMHSIPVDDVPIRPMSKDQVKMHSNPADDIPIRPMSKDQVKMHSNPADDMPIRPMSKERAEESTSKQNDSESKNPSARSSLKDKAVGEESPKRRSHEARQESPKRRSHGKDSREDSQRRERRERDKTVGEESPKRRTYDKEAREESPKRRERSDQDTREESQRGERRERRDKESREKSPKQRTHDKEAREESQRCERREKDKAVGEELDIQPSPVRFANDMPVDVTLIKARHSAVPQFSTPQTSHEEVPGRTERASGVSSLSPKREHHHSSRTRTSHKDGNRGSVGDGDSAAVRKSAYRDKENETAGRKMDENREKDGKAVSRTDTDSSRDRPHSAPPGRRRQQGWPPQVKSTVPKNFVKEKVERIEPKKSSGLFNFD